VLDLNLRQLESSTWRANQRDGLFDLFFATIFLGLAVSQLADGLWESEAATLSLLVGIEALGALGLWQARRWITRPRLGLVKFAPARKRRLRAGAIVLALCVAATVALVVMTSLSAGVFARPVSRAAVSCLVAALILVPLAAIAYFQQFPRILVHGMLFVGAEFAGTWLEAEKLLPFPRAVTFGGACLVSAAVGVTLLVRFLRETRIPPTEGREHA